MNYYQLGGFQAAVYSFGKNVNPLASKVYDHLRRPDGSVDLILGIKSSGSSHLLLTREERDHLRRRINDEEKKAYSASKRSFLGWDNERGSTSTDFESLSPIHFRDQSELEAKLASLACKPGLNDRDTSSLNKGFQGRTVLERAQFENIRVFYRILQKDISSHIFGLSDTSWTSSIRIFSFAYNVWNQDSRSPEDRERSPMVLDLGWCEAQTPTLREIKETTHLVYDKNKNLTNGKRGIYCPDDEQNATRSCDAQTVARKVRDRFREWTARTSRPAILLVHDWKGTLKILNSYGVDVSYWDFELKNLLRVKSEPPRQAPNDPRRRPEQSRARSASPRPHDRSRRVPSPPRRYAPVYVVDVHAMFATSLQMETHTPLSIPDMAKRLGLSDPTGWCAGNECCTLIDVFREMAKRGAIDEQIKEWPGQFVVRNNPDEEQSDYNCSDSE